jgi:chromosome segregation protein
MAEVSMIMNTNGSSNGNGNGSTASHEIMVTRRLYRSGESEFFINKIPCRMKDIIELFLDSGVGSKSYSIMEQGKVDFILSLKPDERRILIEEAAGISKYRSRKKEALSKIQSTRSNLNRLQDVLNEIHIQMRGLDLQVKRLKRYKNIKNEIRDIDLLLAAHRNQDFNTQKENIGRSLEGFKDDGMRIASEINRCEADIERTKLKLVETRRDVAQ